MARGIYQNFHAAAAHRYDICITSGNAAGRAWLIDIPPHPGRLPPICTGGRSAGTNLTLTFD